ncbi:hypothetical protein EH223_10110 [candidate division KSB1 bacterium]|nr:DUF4097 family beta strand repeat protein [candidate division KSB1 bacterium]RQW03400.1 MAG: hypothetical protein EH223_10110 [candidate division KSB1 bacterium]
MHVIKYLTIVATFSFILFLACSNVTDPDSPYNNRYTAESYFSFSINAEDKTKLDLMSINGDIQVVGVENATDVVVAGNKVVKSNSQMDADNYLKNLRVSIAESGNTLYVASDQPKETDGRSVSINYEIQVPKVWTTAIDLANGSCLLDSLYGNIMTKITNGNIMLGSVYTSAYLRVTNGQITGTVNLPKNGVLNAQTTNGVLSFSLPKTTSAQLSAKVTNGTVNIAGLSLSNMVGNQKEIHGNLGAGEGKIELATTNGNISIVGY